MSDWIKLEKDLATDPRVLRMASRLGHADVTLVSRNRLIAIGALVTLWWYADTHIIENNVLPISADEIDELVGITGFSQILPADWFKVIDANNVELIDYLTHNGTTAKKRAQAQKRKAKQRAKGNGKSRKSHASVTHVTPERLAQSGTREDSSSPLGSPLQSLGISTNHSEETQYDALGLSRPAWERFLAYRREIGKPIKKPSVLPAMEKLASFGADQEAVVRQTIANGWQGLFALKHDGGSQVMAVRQQLDKIINGSNHASIPVGRDEDPSSGDLEPPVGLFR